MTTPERAMYPNCPLMTRDEFYEFIKELLVNEAVSIEVTYFNNEEPAGNFYQVQVENWDKEDPEGILTVGTSWDIRVPNKTP